MKPKDNRVELEFNCSMWDQDKCSHYVGDMNGRCKYSKNGDSDDYFTCDSIVAKANKMLLAIKEFGL